MTEDGATEMLKRTEEISDQERIPAAWGESQAKKELFLREYAKTGNIRVVCAKIGVLDRTASAWLSDERNRQRVFFLRQEAIVTEGAGASYAALKEIVTKKRRNWTDEDDDPYVFPSPLRAKVATDLIRLAGHTEAVASNLVQAQRVARLDELTEEQLAAHIAEAQRMLDSAAKAPLTPDDAPGSDDMASLL